jgi:hypothetical protein
MITYHATINSNHVENDHIGKGNPCRYDKHTICAQTSGRRSDYCLYIIYNLCMGARLCSQIIVVIVMSKETPSSRIVITVVSFCFIDTRLFPFHCLLFICTLGSFCPSSRKKKHQAGIERPHGTKHLPYIRLSNLVLLSTYLKLVVRPIYIYITHMLSIVVRSA